MSIGSFVCTSCGGALRKYNQRVKSISMSNFSMQEIFFLKKRGNKACHKIYMALCEGEPREKLENFDDFLRLKYEVRKWYREPGPEIEEEALRENQEALDRASQTQTPKTNRIGVNAAAGLIILPSRSLSSVLSPSPSIASSQSRPNNSFQSGPSNTSSPQPPSNFARLLPDTQVAVSSPPSSVLSDSKVDPFADLFAARPATQPALTVSQTPPSFLAPATATFVSNQSDMKELTIRPSSTQTSSFSFPAPVPADKYAALAELDGMRKVSASTSGGKGLDNFLNGLSSQSQAPPQPSHASASMNTFQFQGNTNPPVFTGDQFKVFEHSRPQQQSTPANPFFIAAPVTSLMNPLGISTPSAIQPQQSPSPGNPFVVQPTATVPTNPFAPSCPAALPQACPPSAFNVPFSSFHTSAPTNGVSSSSFNPFVNAR
ncbi:hypothetical protein AAHC03_0908 [Spirometra sp. Aus1]